ncbi:MAG: hypothetical protein V8P98_05630 [Acutalibacteraceae bacterium]
MNELYKRNKKLQKHKSGGGKTHNKIIPKILSLSVSASLMLAMVPNNGAFAAEPTTFVTTAYANHWGRSDLRAYLNNVEKTNNTLPINSTNSGSNAANYPSQFSKAEYGLVQPFTYATNVLNGNEEATAVYETTDRFWLPSGNFNKNQAISWGADDMSATAQYTKSTQSDKSHIIPIPYWSYGTPSYSSSWLRSPHYGSASYALSAYRGIYVNNDVVHSNFPSPAAAFKIDLASVIFASAASAASIAAAGTGGAKKLEIDGTSAGVNYAEFGQKSDKKLPDYGMYLKTESGSSFSPTGLSLSGTDLAVTYSDGVADQYVVVHAFKEATDEDLTNGTTSYAAAKKLESGNSSATIDITEWKNSEGNIITSLDGYTIKVWMEDGSGSLAKATMPVTFVGTEKKEDGASTNARVFAMKADLQTSWGKLQQADSLVGDNPTNQKIYFGKKDGQPLEFWIAGRESAVNGGEIAADGQFMTLYQAKSVERKQFNASTDMYQKADDNAVTLQLVENQSYSVDAIEKIYPQDQITFKQGNTDLDKTDLKWQHRKPGITAWTDDMPTTPGKYEIRCYAEGTENYERTFSANVTFTVLSKPSAADFDFIPPQNLIYDGQPKEATVKAKDSITGMGAVTIKYFDSTGNQLETAPTDVGPYTVKIDVKEGDLYAAATDLTGADWNFTITEKTVVAPDEPSEPEDFNKSDWGDEEIHSGIKHYVDTNGTTSVEVSENGMIWLREESEGTAAWYGLDNTSGIFKKGSRFYVQWLNENDHPEAFANIDSNTKAEVEDDNGWLFKVGVIAPDGTRYEKLDEKVDLYVQIGDDWDRDDLAAFYISQGEDENIPVRYETSDYPEGEDEFGIMTLSHFSPYFIYDKLTDEEKAEFDKLSDEEKSNLDEIAKEMAVQQEKTADESTKTGDEVTYLTISGLGLIMTLALGLMLNSKINKKKFDE